MLNFLDHLLGGFTAKTTLRISTCLKKFGLFTKGLYRENDSPKILKQTLYRGATAKTNKIPRKRPFEYRENVLYRATMWGLGCSRVVFYMSSLSTGLIEMCGWRSASLLGPHRTGPVALSSIPGLWDYRDAPYLRVRDYPVEQTVQYMIPKIWLILSRVL